jgi:hypothetical protein
VHLEVDVAPTHVFGHGHAHKDLVGRLVPGDAARGRGLGVTAVDDAEQRGRDDGRAAASWVEATLALSTRGTA